MKQLRGEDYDAYMDRMAAEIAEMFDSMDLKLTEVCYVCTFLMASAIEQMKPESRETALILAQEFFNKLVEKKERTH